MIPSVTSLIDNHHYNADQMLDALARILTRRERLAEDYPSTPVNPADLKAKIQHVLWFHNHITQRGPAGGTMPSNFTTQLLHLLEAATPEQAIKISMGFPEYAWLMQHVARHGFWTLQRAIGAV